MLAGDADCALHACHICTGTGLTPATSAPGLGPPLLPHLHRDWASGAADAMLAGDTDCALHAVARRVQHGMWAQSIEHAAWHVEL